MDCNFTSRKPGICLLPLSTLGLWSIRGRETAAPLKGVYGFSCNVHPA